MSIAVCFTALVQIKCFLMVQQSGTCSTGTEPAIFKTEWLYLITRVPSLTGEYWWSSKSLPVPVPPFPLLLNYLWRFLHLTLFDKIVTSIALANQQQNLHNLWSCSHYNWRGSAIDFELTFTARSFPVAPGSTHAGWLIYSLQVKANKQARRQQEGIMHSVSAACHCFQRFYIFFLEKRYGLQEAPCDKLGRYVAWQLYVGFGFGLILR